VPSVYPGDFGFENVLGAVCKIGAADAMLFIYFLPSKNFLPKSEIPFDSFFGLFFLCNLLEPQLKVSAASILDSLISSHY